MALPPPTPPLVARGPWRPWWFPRWSVVTAVINRHEVPVEHQRLAQVLGRLWDGFVAVLISVVAQVPLGAFQFMMRSEGSMFPASICAMLSVYMVFTLLDKCRPGLGLDRFYTLHLSPAADLLNRHMSIGFTAPFVMMCRNPLPSDKTIGLVIACFVVTGILNVICAFVLAYTFHTILSGWLLSQRYASWKREAKRVLARLLLRLVVRGRDGKRSRASSPGDDGDLRMNPTGRPRSWRIQSWPESPSLASFRTVELEDRANSKTAVSPRGLAGTDTEPGFETSASLSGRVAPVGKREPGPEHEKIEASTTKHVPRNVFGGNLGGREEGEEDTGEDRPGRTFLVNLHLTHPIMVFCWFMTIVVGLPLLAGARYDLVFSTFLLFAVWLSTLAVQASIKGDALEANMASPPFAATRILLVGLTNPVLITSLAMIAYVNATASATSRPIGAVLDAFQYNSTVPQALGILPYTSKSSIFAERHGPPPMAAGDVAIAVLNAGLVAWGLKLFQYRRHLCSPAGLAAVLSAAAMAAGNFFLGPKLALEMGLGMGEGQAGGPDGQAAVVDLAQPLAFAARSVTLALGAPAMTALGGDAGLNAAMVVVSGIVYQMGLGLGVGKWLEGLVRAVEARFLKSRQSQSADEEKAIGDEKTASLGLREWASRAGPGHAQVNLLGVEDAVSPSRRGLPLPGTHTRHNHPQPLISGATTAANSARPSQDIGNINITTDVDIFMVPHHPTATGIDAIDAISSITIAARSVSPAGRKQQDGPSCTPTARAGLSSDPLPAQAVDALTVAAGATVGCNSAAMGTAYLYETRSEAAPYSALSMVMLGVVTVALAFAGPTAAALRGLLGG